MIPIIRTYSELITISTFEERLEYCRIHGTVGMDTFGFDSIFRQRFLQSYEWKQIRNFVISRDLGCDLGASDREIKGVITIHHLNPISMDDIRNSTPFLLDPEYLICTSDATHKMIHYGTKLNAPPIVNERKPGDTCPWKH